MAFEIWNLQLQICICLLNCVNIIEFTQMCDYIAYYLVSVVFIRRPFQYLPVKKIHNGITYIGKDYFCMEPKQAMVKHIDMFILEKL